MSRRGSRPIIFICGSLSTTGDLIMESVNASVQADAISLFKDKYGFAPKTILGPFYQKRKQILENTINLKFTNDIRKAEYDGWIVNAVRLVEPDNHAYLIFSNRIDNKKMTLPKGTVVVPYSNLRIIQDA